MIVRGVLCKKEGFFGFFHRDYYENNIYLVIECEGLCKLISYIIVIFRILFKIKNNMK